MLPRSTCYKVMLTVVPMIFFLGADVNIASALSAIQADFKIPYHILQWLISANCIFLGAFSVLSGKIGDAKGLKNSFLVGVLIVLIGSALGFLAPNVWILIGARAMQGLGASFIAGISMGIFAKYFPDDLKKTAVTANFLSGSLGTVCAPYINGLCISYASWRYIFLFWVCYSFLFLVASYIVIPSSINVKQKIKIQILDSLLLCLSIGLFITWVSQGNKWHFASFKSSLVILLSILAGGSFAFLQRRRKEPLIDLSLFSHREFTAGCLMIACIFFVFYSFFYSLSLYYLQVKFIPVAFVGNHVVPLSIGLLFSFTLLIKMTKNVSSKVKLLTALTLLFLVTNFIALNMRYELGAISMIVALFIAGACVGISMNTVGGIILLAVPSKKAGLGGGVFAASRFLGGAIGVAVFTSIFTYIGDFDFTQYFAENQYMLTSAMRDKVYLIMSGTLSEHQMQAFFPQVKASILQSTSTQSISNGLSDSMALLSLLPALSILICIFMLKKSDEKSKVFF